MSSEDGSLLRRSKANLNFSLVAKRFCRESAEAETAICATWIPRASPYPDGRCRMPDVEFLTVDNCRKFLADMKDTYSGILQAFVEPLGVSNSLIRTFFCQDIVQIRVCTNRMALSDNAKPFDRCATFEGWPSVHVFSTLQQDPHMPDDVLAASRRLNELIRTKRVKQMHLLDTTQHIALHFKRAKDCQLFFVYASVYNCSRCQDDADSTAPNIKEETLLAINGMGRQLSPRRQFSPHDRFEIEGLRELFSEAKLLQHLHDAQEKLHEWGAVHINEVLSDTDLLTQLEQHLQLKLLEQRRFRRIVESIASGAAPAIAIQDATPDKAGNFKLVYTREAGAPTADFQDFPESDDGAEATD